MSEVHNLVRFVEEEPGDEPRKTYERFVDPNGQEDPEAFLALLNKREDK